MYMLRKILGVSWENGKAYNIVVRRTSWLMVTILMKDTGS